MSTMRQRIYEVLSEDKYYKKNPRVPETPNTGDTTTDTTSDLDYGFGVSNVADIMAKNANLESQVNALNNKILGMPHQFLESADRRIDSNNNFGYRFFRNIYREKPTVTILPGAVNFLPDYSKADKKAFASLAGDIDNENSKKALEDLIGENTEFRYYDFKSAYSQYIRYVNILCRVAAVYLGIEKEKGPDGVKSYGAYDWGDYQTLNNYSNPIPDGDKSGNSMFFDTYTSFSDFIGEKLTQLKDDTFAGYRQYVNFYVDPSTSINETASNSTQKSQLEGAFDSVEGIVKEATMLLASANDYQDTASAFVDTAASAVAGLANTVTLGAFKNLLGLAEKEVLHGANLIYPEIWTDSDYSKSYTINLTLTSPYGDKEAIYLNVLVPLLHALCLALPRQTSANSFASPFIVRAFSKGWFSCDMGMVESITIDKGPEQSWSVEGLPTQAKVTLQIKDLYSQLMIPEPKASMFFANQGMMDFLGALCGINLAMPNPVLKFKVASALFVRRITDIPNNFYRDITENVNQIFMDWFKM